MTTATEIIDKLYERLIVTSSGCWEFIGARTGDGYGAVCIGNGKSKGAHVVSYEMQHGPIAKGKFVCHTCDNPPCCNPKHLFLGTLQDNKDDEIAKDRHVYGSRVGTSKLIEDQIIQIKALLKQDYSLALIGRRFGVSRQMIHRIKTGQAWSWIP